MDTLTCSKLRTSATSERCPARQAKNWRSISSSCATNQKLCPHSIKSHNKNKCFTYKQRMHIRYKKSFEITLSLKPSSNRLMNSKTRLIESANKLCMMTGLRKSEHVATGFSNKLNSFFLCILCFLNKSNSFQLVVIKCLTFKSFEASNCALRPSKPLK